MVFNLVGPSMNLEKTIPICHACPHRSGHTCSQLQLPIDKVDKCPEGFFGGLGDILETVLDATKIGPVVKSIIRRVTGKPCKCGERKQALNRLT